MPTLNGVPGSRPFLGAIAPVLTWMRNEKGIQLDLGKIRDATELSNVVLLATKKQIKFTDSATGASETLEFPDMPAALVQTLRSYLGQTGGFDLDVSLKDQRSQTPSEQHSYITMQFTEVFSQWLVSLGHIFKVRTGDVDMLDVVLNRRILVVILPSLENSDKTNAGLGKIVVAMLRSMMALTLGAKLEGDYQEIVGNRPSEAFAPFKVVFDELAYYVTAGMDGMLAQGRGLGLHFLLGFQEAAGLAARIGEKMWSLLGNANLQIIMRLQDGNQTRTYIEKTAGEAHVTQSTSYSSASDLSDAHVAADHAEVRQVRRVPASGSRPSRPGWLPCSPATASACRRCPHAGRLTRTRATPPMRRRCPARPKPRGRPERSRAAGTAWRSRPRTTPSPTCCARRRASGTCRLPRSPTLAWRRLRTRS